MRSSLSPLSTTLASSVPLLSKRPFITNALGHCLAVDGGDVSVQNSTLAQFYPFDASRGTALYFSATDNPLLALECRNSLVTGYSDDEMTDVHGGEDNENAFNYMFYGLYSA